MKCCDILQVQVTEKEEIRVYQFSSLLEEVTVFSYVSQAFDCSIRKDEHLAVAFFQRGMTFYKKERQDTPVISKCFIFNVVI